MMYANSADNFIQMVFALQGEDCTGGKRMRCSESQLVKCFEDAVTVSFL